MPRLKTYTTSWDAADSNIYQLISERKQLVISKNVPTPKAQQFD
jgi:hypothetical protein